MTFSLDDMKRLHASLDDNTKLDEPHSISIPKNFPAADDITLLTFNFFDNGEGVKVTWREARYVMNLQVFTQTEPFTPSKALAAWEGSVQLHSMGFVGRYVTAKFEAEYDRVRDILNETDRLEATCSDVRLGQLYSKRGGTRYLWGTMLRTYVDDLGEFNAELLHDGRIIKDEGFGPNTNPNSPKLKLIGRYDPHGLWRSGREKFSRKVKGGRS